MFGVKVSLAGILRLVTKTIKENNIFKIILFSKIFIANIIKWSWLFWLGNDIKSDQKILIPKC